MPLFALIAAVGPVADQGSPYFVGLRRPSICITGNPVPVHLQVLLARFSTCKADSGRHCSSETGRPVLALLALALALALVGLDDLIERNGDGAFSS
jgi:hypothetical protein